jgi:hypothetical protein
MSEHLWKLLGRAKRQRQCVLCGLWETAETAQSPCYPALR